MKRLLTILKSKTFWGGAIAAAGVVLSAPHVTPGVVAEAAGILLGAAGVRDSVTKLASGAYNL